MAREVTFTVAAVGVGKRDYSRTASFVSQPTLRGHQVKIVAVYSYTDLPTRAFDLTWGVAIPFMHEDGEWHDEAGRTPAHLMRGGISTGRNALVVIGLYEYSSYASFLAGDWPPLAIHGHVYGYKNAELTVTNGIKTEEGHCYVLVFMEWSGFATFNCHLYGEMLWESETQ